MMTMMLNQQLDTPIVDVRATALLAQSYSRSVGVHAARALGNEAPSALGWISPRGVWLSLAVSPERPLRSSERADLELAILEGQGSRPPTTITTLETASDWDLEAAQIISRTTNGRVDETSLRVAADPTNWYRETLQSAIELMRKAWPEGAVEFSTLIRNVIVLDATELTASHDQLFGTIFSGTSYITSLAQAYELLLHECGHHSMFLRVWKNDLVTNPDMLVSHPLRHDSRPISGTLHAAYSLWRMYFGMKAWCDNPALDPGVEAIETRDRDLDRLTQTLQTLAASAEWTPAGERLFTNMRLGVLE